MLDLRANLIPVPRRFDLTGGECLLPVAPTVLWQVPQEWFFPAMPTLREALPPESVMLTDGARTADITLLEDAACPPEGFALTADPGRVTLKASSRAGLFYGAQTLARLLEAAEAACESLPCFTVEDSPDFRERGVMLDISRNKVPTLQTLFHLVDLLSVLRYNQLQLYMEHPFAYTNHADVWLNVSPMTPEDIRALDAYCQIHCIELVPNQNSFGHLEKWLAHERYLPLAELPQGGAPLPWGGTRAYPSAITPEGDDALAFLAGLYDELLPNFSSTRFNVGCDEVFDLRGEGGRSAERVRREGEGKVYLDFIRRICALVRERGRRPMLWADIILQHPECISALPEGMTALIWGYEADHPFDCQCRALADAGVPFYVCPGTSSWMSLAGRTANMRANIRSAARAGLANGAAGFLLCDWGDWGHWQPLSVSFPALVEGSCQAWCAAANAETDLAAAMERSCVAPGYAQILIGLGDLYRFCGAERANASELFRLLATPKGTPVPEGITREKLLDVMSRMEGLLLKLPKKPSSSDGESAIQHQEIVLVSRLLRIACLRGLARLSNGAEAASRAAAEQQGLRSLFIKVWRLRNRIGGLSDSLEKLGC
ncbi:MAG: family 20 glycosylhydrolase [Kiritimatiellae bacterium]|nr:family 20 glycosylhydrolase [Kiritimatiellia bacterium]